MVMLHPMGQRVLGEFILRGRRLVGMVTKWHHSKQQTSHGLRGFVVLPATPSVQARSAADEHEHAIRHRLGRIHTSCIAAVVRTSSQVFGQTHRLERSKRTLEGRAFSQRRIGCILWSCWSRDDPRYTAGQDPFKLCAWRWSVAGACRTPAPSWRQYEDVELVLVHFGVFII